MYTLPLSPLSYRSVYTRKCKGVVVFLGMYVCPWNLSSPFLLGQSSFGNRYIIGNFQGRGRFTVLDVHGTLTSTQS